MGKVKDETIVKLVYTQTPDTSTTQYKLFLHTEDVWKMSRKFPVNLERHLQVTACRFACTDCPSSWGALPLPHPTCLPRWGSGRSSTGLEGRLSRLEREGPGAIRLSARDGKQVVLLWFMGCPLDAWTSTGEDRPSKNSFFFPQRAAESCR